MSYKTIFATYKNIVYQAIGLVLVALGIIGIFLPIMPTTIFFILALGCFTRSSPKLAAWLLNHPRYGASLYYWHEYKVVPLKAKCFAGLGMLTGFILLALTSPPGWVLYIVGVIEVSVMIYLISRPTTVNQARKGMNNHRQTKVLALFMAILIHSIVLAIVLYKPN